MFNKIYLPDFRKEQCSIDCYKAMGSIPQLHCQKCLRLFHHECMDLSKDANIAYKCKVDKIMCKFFINKKNTYMAL